MVWRVKVFLGLRDRTRHLRRNPDIERSDFLLLMANRSRRRRICPGIGLTPSNTRASLVRATPASAPGLGVKPATCRGMSEPLGAARARAQRRAACGHLRELGAPACAVTPRSQWDPPGINGTSAPVRARLASRPVGSRPVCAQPRAAALRAPAEDDGRRLGRRFVRRRSGRRAWARRTCRCTAAEQLRGRTMPWMHQGLSPNWDWHRSRIP